MEKAKGAKLNKRFSLKSRIVLCAVAFVICIASFVTATFAWYSKASPVETPISAGLYFIDANSLQVDIVAQKDENENYVFMDGYGDNGFVAEAVEGDVTPVTVKASGTYKGSNAVGSATYDLSDEKVYRITFNMLGSSSIPGYVIVEGPDGVHYSHSLLSQSEYAIEIRPSVAGYYTLTSSWGSCDADFSEEGVYRLHNTAYEYAFEDTDAGNHWHYCEYDGCDYIVDTAQHYFYEWSYEGTNPYVDGHQHICECNRAFTEAHPEQDYTVAYKALFHENTDLDMTTKKLMPNAAVFFEYLDGENRVFDKSRVVELDGSSECTVELLDGTYLVNYIVSVGSSSGTISANGKWYSYANEYQDSYLYSMSTRIEVKYGVPQLTLEGGKTGWIEENGDGYYVIIAEKFSNDVVEQQAWEYLQPSRNGIGYDMYSRYDYRYNTGREMDGLLNIKGAEMNYSTGSITSSGGFDKPMVVSFTYEVNCGQNIRIYPTIFVALQGQARTYQLLNWDGAVTFKSTEKSGIILGYLGSQLSGINSFEVRLVVQGNKLTPFMYDYTQEKFVPICDTIVLPTDIVDLAFGEAHEEDKGLYDTNESDYWIYKNFQINPLIDNKVELDGWTWYTADTGSGSTAVEFSKDGENVPTLEDGYIAEDQDGFATIEIRSNEYQGAVNKFYDDDIAVVSGTTEIIITPRTGDTKTIGGVTYKVVYIVRNIYVDGVAIPSSTTIYDENDPYSSVYVTTGYFNSLAYDDFEDGDDPITHIVTFDVEEVFYPGVDLTLTLATRDIYSENYIAGEIQSVLLSNKEVVLTSPGIERVATTNANGQVTFNYVYDGEYTISYGKYSWTFVIDADYDNGDVVYTLTVELYDEELAKKYPGTSEDPHYVEEKGVSFVTRNAYATSNLSSETKGELILGEKITLLRDYIYRTTSTAETLAQGGYIPTEGINPYNDFDRISYGNVIHKDVGYIAFEGDNKHGNGVYDENGVPSLENMGTASGFGFVDIDVAYSIKYIEFSVYDPMVIFGTSDPGSNVIDGVDYSSYCLYDTGRNADWWINAANHKGERIDFGSTVVLMVDKNNVSLTYGTHVYVELDGTITWNIRFGDFDWNYSKMTPAQLAKFRTTGLKIGVASDGYSLYGYADDGYGNMEIVARQQGYKDGKLHEFIALEKIGTHFIDSYITGFKMFGELPKVSLSQTQFANGSIAYNDVHVGEDLTVTVTPDDGYELESFKLDGKEVSQYFENNVAVLKEYSNIYTNVEVTFKEIVEKAGQYVKVYGGYPYDIQTPIDGQNVYFTDDNGKVLATALVEDGTAILLMDASVIGSATAHLDGYEDLTVTILGGRLLLETLEFTRLLDNNQEGFEKTVDADGNVTLSANTATYHYIDNDMDLRRNARIDFDLSMRFNSTSRYYEQIVLQDYYGDNYNYQLLLWGNAGRAPNFMLKGLHNNNEIYYIYTAPNATSIYLIEAHVTIRVNDTVVTIDITNINVTDETNKTTASVSDFHYVDDVHTARDIRKVYFIYDYEKASKPADGSWKFENFTINYDYAKFYDPSDRITVTTEEDLRLFDTTDLTINVKNAGGSVNKVAINDIWFSADGNEYTRDSNGTFTVLAQDYGQLVVESAGVYTIKNFYYDSPTHILQVQLDILSTVLFMIELRDEFDVKLPSAYKTETYNGKTYELNYLTMVGKTYGAEYKANFTGGASLTLYDVVPDTYIVTAHVDDEDCDFETDYYPTEVVIDMREVYSLSFDYMLVDTCQYEWKSRLEVDFTRDKCCYDASCWENGCFDEPCAKTPKTVDDTKAKDGELYFYCNDTLGSNFVQYNNTYDIHSTYAEMNIRNPRLYNEVHPVNWEGNGDDLAEREAGGTWFRITAVDKNGVGKSEPLTFGSVYFKKDSGTPGWQLRWGALKWQTITLSEEQLAKFNTAEGLKIGVAIEKYRVYAYVENVETGKLEFVSSLHISHLNGYTDGDYFVGIAGIGSNIQHMENSYTNLGTDVIVDGVTELKFGMRGQEDNFDFDYNLKTVVLDENGNEITNNIPFAGTVEAEGGFFRQFRVITTVSPLYYIKSFTINGYDIIPKHAYATIVDSSYKDGVFTMYSCYFHNVDVVVTYAPRVAITVSDIRDWGNFNGVIRFDNQDDIWESYTIYNSKALINPTVLPDGSYRVWISGEGHSGHQVEGTLQVLNGVWQTTEFYIDYDYSKHLSLVDGKIRTFTDTTHKTTMDNSGITVGNGTNYGAKIVTQATTSNVNYFRYIELERDLNTCAEATLKFKFSYTAPANYKYSSTGCWPGPYIVANSGVAMDTFQLLTWTGSGLIIKPYFGKLDGDQANQVAQTFGGQNAGNKLSVNVEISFNNETGEVIFIAYRDGFNPNTWGNVTTYSYNNATYKKQISTTTSGGYTMAVKYAITLKGIYLDETYWGFGLLQHSNLHLGGAERYVPEYTFDDIIIRHTSSETMDIGDFTAYKGFYEELPVTGYTNGIMIDENSYNHNYFRFTERNEKVILHISENTPDGNHTFTARRGEYVDTFNVKVDGDVPKNVQNNYASYVTYLDSKIKEFEQRTFNKDDLTFFLGDSFMDERYFFKDFTRRFIDRNAFSFGISSSTAEQWHWYGQKLYKYQPKNIVMHIGTNDIFDSKKNATDTTKILKKMFEDYHMYMPNTKIYWYSIEPRLNTSNKDGNATAVTVNSNIKSYANGKDWLVYVDSATEFAKDAYTNTSDLTTLKADKSSTKLYSDNVHPNSVGYDVMIKLAEKAGLNVGYNPNYYKGIVYEEINTTIYNDYDDMWRLPGIINDDCLITMKITIHETATVNPPTAASVPHISFHFDNTTGDGHDYHSRFLLMDRYKDGKFYVTGHMNSGARDVWSESYVQFTEGVDLTLEVAIFIYGSNAYFFLNGKLMMIYENHPPVNTLEGFRFSSENMAVTFNDVMVSYRSEAMTNYTGVNVSTTTSDTRFPGPVSSAYWAYSKKANYVASTFAPNDGFDTLAQNTSQRLIAVEGQYSLTGGGEVRVQDVGTGVEGVANHNRDAWLLMNGQRGISLSSEGVAVQFDFTVTEWIAPTKNTGAFLGISIEKNDTDLTWKGYSMFIQNEITNNNGVYSTTNMFRFHTAWGNMPNKYGDWFDINQYDTISCTMIYQKKGGANDKDRVILGMSRFGTNDNFYVYADLDSSYSNAYIRFAMELLGGKYSNWRMTRDATEISAMVNSIPSYKN